MARTDDILTETGEIRPEIAELFEEEPAPRTRTQRRVAQPHIAQQRRGQPENRGMSACSIVFIAVILFLMLLLLSAVRSCENAYSKSYANNRALGVVITDGARFTNGTAVPKGTMLIVDHMDYRGWYYAFVEGGASGWIFASHILPLNFNIPNGYRVVKARFDGVAARSACDESSKKKRTYKQNETLLVERWIKDGWLHIISPDLYYCYVQESDVEPVSKWFDTYPTESVNRERNREHISPRPE